MSQTDDNIPIFVKQSSPIHESLGSPVVPLIAVPVTSEEIISQFTIDEATEKIGFGFFQIKLLVFSCLIWMADSMEIMLLAILGPVVRCQWSLSLSQEAFITTSVFIGMALGSTLWGILCDRYGRRRTLRISTFFLVCFSLLTALAPSYYWLVLVRFCVGVCVSSLPQAVTYSVEFFPIKFRVLSSVMIGLSWGLGSCFEALLALLVMRSLGWRYLLVFSAVPSLVVLFLFPCVPTSPRYLLACGEEKKAHRVLQSVAKQNCKQLPPGELVACKTQTSEEESPLLANEEGTSETRIMSRGKLVETFYSKYAVTTVILIFFWFSCGFTYYGVVIISTQFSLLSAHCRVSNVTSIGESMVACRILTNEDYMQFLISSFAEFPGMLILILLNDTIGRKLTKTFLLSVGAVMATIVLICTGTNDKIVKTVLMFGVRSCVTAAIQTGFLYAPEVYPTAIRASALAVFTMMARLGGIVTPFVATVLIDTSLTAAISVYVSMLVVAAVLTVLLPFETKGTPLGVQGKRRFC